MLRSALTLIITCTYRAQPLGLFAIYFKIANNPLFHGTQDILEKILKKYGVEVSWVTSGCNVEGYRKSVKPTTKILTFILTRTFGDQQCLTVSIIMLTIVLIRQNDAANKASYG